MKISLFTRKEDVMSSLIVHLHSNLELPKYEQHTYTVVKKPTYTNNRNNEQCD